MFPVRPRTIALLAALVAFLVATSVATSAPSEPAPDRGERSTRPLERAANGATELPELRTERSRTYRTREAAREVKIFTEPVNFRDAGGKWQPIDNALRRARAGIVNGDAGYSGGRCSCRATGAGPA